MSGKFPCSRFFPWSPLQSPGVPNWPTHEPLALVVGTLLAALITVIAIRYGFLAMAAAFGLARGMPTERSIKTQ